MDVKAVKLRFTAPLHVGERGLGMEEVNTMIHSDTLYGAIYSLWCRVYGPPPGHLPLSISSAFPYLKNEYYYPKPNLPVSALSDPDLRSAYGKWVKRARYVPESLFSPWIGGSDFSLVELERSQHRLAQAITQGVRPRVALDRISQDSSFYQVGEVHFRRDQDLGLYFLLRTGPNGLWQKVQPVIKLLGEEGIGGERSQGYGRFTPIFREKFSYPEVKGGKNFLTLSLIYPAGPKETVNSLLFYRLLKRGGWIYSPGTVGNHQHLRVNMFAEGSIFSRPLNGSIVDVAPGDFARRYHPVYRYGRSFLLRVK